MDSLGNEELKRNLKARHMIYWHNWAITLALEIVAGALVDTKYEH